MRDTAKHYPIRKIVWDYDLDGQSNHYRIKGKDKKYYKKLRRRKTKQFERM